MLAYRNAIEAGELSHDGDERFAGAIGNCHKRMLPFLDDKEERMFVLQKERPGSPLKIDPAPAEGMVDGRHDTGRRAKRTEVQRGTSWTVYETASTPTPSSSPWMARRLSAW